MHAGTIEREHDHEERQAEMVCHNNGEHDVGKRHEKEGEQRGNMGRHANHMTQRAPHEHERPEGTEREEESHDRHGTVGSRKRPQQHV